MSSGVTSAVISSMVYYDGLLCCSWLGANWPLIGYSLDVGASYTRNKRIPLDHRGESVRPWIVSRGNRLPPLSPFPFRGLLLAFGCYDTLLRNERKDLFYLPSDHGCHKHADDTCWSEIH